MNWTTKDLEKLQNRRTSGKGQSTTANGLTKEVISTLRGMGFIVWRNNTTGVFDPQKTVAKLLKFINSLSYGKPTAKAIAGCFVFREHHGRKGVPDILGYQKKTGRFIAVEIKAGKDKLSIEQKHFIQEANQYGAMSCKVSRIEDLFEYLKQQSK